MKILKTVLPNLTKTLSCRNPTELPSSIISKSKFFTTIDER